MPYVFYDMPNSKYKILFVVIFCSFQNVFYEVNKFPFVETNTKIRQDFYSATVAILQFSYKFFCFVQCVKFSYVKQTQIIGHNAMNFKSDAFLQVEIYNGKLIRL